MRAPQRVVLIAQLRNVIHAYDGLTRSRHIERWLSALSARSVAVDAAVQGPGLT